MKATPIFYTSNIQRRLLKSVVVGGDVRSKEEESA